MCQTLPNPQNTKTQKQNNLSIFCQSNNELIIFSRQQTKQVLIFRDFCELQLFEYICTEKLAPTERCSGQGNRLLLQRSRVSIPGNTRMSNYSSLPPTVGCVQKLVGGRYQIHSSVELVELDVWSFPWFSLKFA